MRLLPRKHSPRRGSAEEAISAARSAAAEAGERLASAAGIRADAAEQAAHEQRTLITELRAMRERNHLADMILDSVHRGSQ